jgi:subtilase family serine protease
VLSGVAFTAQASTRHAPKPNSKHVCGSVPKTPHRYACLAIMRTDSVHAFVAAQAAPPGYGPADLQSAYKLPSATAGAGQTVAIVDAMDDPNAEADLAVYRSRFGLPPCTTANGCFHKVNQNGDPSPLPASDVGWAGEISLDLDMVSAICPNCNILLIEANQPDGSLFTAINTAVAMGAKFISNSWGGQEFSNETAFDAYYLDWPGVAITASSGDDGFGVTYPASSRYVTAVGGTSLMRSADSRGFTESAWQGAGSGCSTYVSKPSWQKDTGCGRRTVADVSAVANPNTGVAVYDTFGEGGWLIFGGTSVASPIIASTYALAGTPTAGTVPASYLYAHPDSLFDVTNGPNGLCDPVYLCSGVSGYDGPTGLGTPNGLAAFTARSPVPPPRRPGPTASPTHGPVPRR